MKLFHNIVLGWFYAFILSFPSFADEFRTIDGSNNNLANPQLGTPDAILKRIAPVSYVDKVSEPAGADRPNPREISNIVLSQSDDKPSDRGLSDMAWVWGQFFTHDISLTEPAFPLEPGNIPIPLGDPFFDPERTGTQLLPFNRSDYDRSTGTSPTNPRQQINEITTWIDASVVYGSDKERADFLRKFKKGKLKKGEERLLPFNNSFPNAGPPTPITFIAGDKRANENVALTAMHTLWIREHNRLASKIFKGNPELSDEQIYQRARALVYAQIQAITYNEWLPTLFGSHKLNKYQGYDPSVDPTIAHAFSVAAFRLGHSMLSDVIRRVDAKGNTIPEGDLLLKDAFFAPDKVIFEGGIEPVLRGLSLRKSQEIDAQVVTGVRNFLNGDPGFGGLDLATFNILRGRDHGLPNYNVVRSAYGLSPARDFSDISSDQGTRNRLRRVYQQIDRVDPWIGLLAEDHLPGASVGEGIFTILKDQLERLRDGDRFWYQIVFNEEESEWLEKQTLFKVIKRNTSIKAREIPKNVFFVE